MVVDEFAYHAAVVETRSVLAFKHGDLPERIGCRRERPRIDRRSGSRRQFNRVNSSCFMKQHDWLARERRLYVEI